jgi:hypothetical protein
MIHQMFAGAFPIRYLVGCPLLKRMTSAHGVFGGQREPRLDQFVGTSRPIRVWRNVGLTSIDGMNHFKAHGEKYYDDQAPSNTMLSQYGSRLNVSTVTRDIVSAVVVVDAAKVRDLNFGQWAVLWRDLHRWIWTTI